MKRNVLPLKFIKITLTILMTVGLKMGVNAQTIYQQDAADADGLVVIGAENYTSYSAGDTDKNGRWDKESNSADFSTSSDKYGAAYMRSYMDGGENYDVNNAQLTYTVNFTQTGTYTIWEYVNNAGSGGEGDTYYVHFDGSMLTGNKIVYDNAYKASNEWKWKSQSFTVSATGQYDIVVTQREANLVIDQIVIAFSSSSVDPGTSFDFDPYDATLSALSVTGYSLDPVFDPSTQSYTVPVPSGTSSVDIVATASGTSATLSGDGTVSLSAPETKSVVVMAEDGVTQETYDILFTSGPSTDATLSALSVTGYDLVPAFDGATTDYSVLVPEGTSSVEISATENNEAATISGDTGKFVCR